MSRTKSTLYVLLALVVLQSSLIAQVGWRDKVSVTVFVKAGAAAPDANIDVLPSDPRERKFEELCLLTATGGQTIFNSKKGSDFIEKLKVEARKCGGEALVLRSSEDQTWKPLRGGIDKGARAQAMVIRYIE